VSLIHRDLVAVLADDARPHLVQRVATLTAAGGEVLELAGDHGRGFDPEHSVSQINESISASNGGAPHSS
jgi:hypothetical protein